MVSARRLRDFFQNVVKLLAISRRRCSRNRHDVSTQTPEVEEIQTAAESSERSKEADGQKINEAVGTGSSVKKRVRFNARIYFDDGTSKLEYRREDEKIGNDWIRTRYTLDDLQELAGLQLDLLRIECQAKYAFLRNKQQSNESGDDSGVGGESRDGAAKPEDESHTGHSSNLLVGICVHQSEDGHMPISPTPSIYYKKHGRQLQIIIETQCCESAHPFSSIVPHCPSMQKSRVLSTHKAIRQWAHSSQILVLLRLDPPKLTFAVASATNAMLESRFYLRYPRETRPQDRDYSTEDFKGRCPHCVTSQLSKPIVQTIRSPPIDTYRTLAFRSQPVDSVDRPRQANALRYISQMILSASIPMLLSVILSTIKVVVNIFGCQANDGLTNPLLSSTPPFVNFPPISLITFSHVAHLSVLGYFSFIVMKVNLRIIKTVHSKDSDSVCFIF
ncbi:hypothetical protein Aperf_G00000077847 [Anoplocephala perfoliata]